MMGIRRGREATGFSWWPPSLVLATRYSAYPHLIFRIRYLLAIPISHCLFWFQHLSMSCVVVNEKVIRANLDWFNVQSKTYLSELPETRCWSRQFPVGTLNFFPLIFAQHLLWICTLGGCAWTLQPHWAELTLVAGQLGCQPTKGGWCQPCQPQGRDNASTHL